MTPWALLGIEATDDKRAIKRAYLGLLKHCHPEDDQQAFIRLNSAYEQALQIAEFHLATPAPAKPLPQDIEDSAQPWVGEPACSDAAPTFADDLPSQSDDPVPANEAYLDEMLDDYRRYSDIGLDRQGAQRDDYDIDFVDEYDACIDALMELLDNDESSDYGDAWQQLFEHKILLNLQYRQYFCTELIARLEEYLQRRKNLNRITPRIILLIEGFLTGTADIEKGLHIPDMARIALSELGLEARKHVNRSNKQKSKKEWLVWILWIYFSMRGRINRIEFSAAFATIWLGVPMLLSSLTILVTMVTAGVEALAAEPGGGAELDPLRFQINQQPPQNNDADAAAYDEAMRKRQQLLDRDLFAEESDIELRLEVNGDSALAPILGEDQQKRRELLQNSGVDSAALLDQIREKQRQQESTPRPAKRAGAFADWWKYLLAGLALWSFLALAVKRVHDTSRSPAALLVIVIPGVGPFLFLLVLYANPQKSDNEHGVYTARKARNLSQFRRLVYKSLTATA